MALIVGIAVIFIVLLLLPFVVAMLSVRKSREASLYVKSDNVRDPRFFSNSFRALVQKGIDRQNRTIKMSKLEPFVFARDLTGAVCDTLVIAERPFRPVGISEFQKEILAEDSAFLSPNTIVRAIACLGELTLGDNCEIIRWADAEQQMTVNSGCTLGMSTTSAERLLIAPDCSFRRLYAPEILIGRQTMETMRFPSETKVYDERLINPKNIAANQEVRYTIITEHSITIGEGAVVMGSVKSDHHVYIHKGAKVFGNVIADGAVILEEDVHVLGSVFSQDNVLVGPNAEIGVKPKIKSLIARKKITLCETAKVFGYVGSELESVTIEKDAYLAELHSKEWSSKTSMARASLEDEDDLFESEPTPARRRARPASVSSQADDIMRGLDDTQRKTPPAAKFVAEDADEEEDSLFD